MEIGESHFAGFYIGGRQTGGYDTRIEAVTTQDDRNIH